MRLVICVDRDDDLGTKAGISTPVRGRQACLEAGIKLALQDPADSDVNAIFCAIKLHDQLRSMGEDADVVVISGSPKRGLESDLKLAKQLDQVIARADSVIVVTDGEEDELILPILRSRVKLDHLERLVVKQSRQLESGFFQLREVIVSPWFSRTVLAPLGAILMILGMGFALGAFGAAMAGVMMMLGIYVLSRGLGLGDWVRRFGISLRDSLYQGKFSSLMYLLALVLLILGTIHGTTAQYDPNRSLIAWIAIFLHSSIWWYVSAVLCYGSGKLMDLVLARQLIWDKLRLLFLVLAFGMIAWGGSMYVVMELSSEGLRFFLMSLLGAILIAIFGIRLCGYLKQSIPQRIQLGSK